MKVKGRIYTPTGRQFEMMEIIFEGEETEVKKKMKESAKELYHCLKEVKETNGQSFYVNDKMWRRFNEQWEYYDTEKKSWCIE